MCGTGRREGRGMEIALTESGNRSFCFRPLFRESRRDSMLLRRPSAWAFQVTLSLTFLVSDLLPFVAAVYLLLICGSEPSLAVSGFAAFASFDFHLHNKLNLRFAASSERQLYQMLNNN